MSVLKLGFLSALLLVCSLGVNTVRAQSGGGGGGNCVEIIKYNCPNISALKCKDMDVCHWNTETPPALECGAIETHDLPEELGQTEPVAPWEQGTDATAPDGTAYCYQVRACLKYCVTVMVDGVEEQICKSSTLPWGNTAPYTKLKDTGEICHP